MIKYAKIAPKNGVTIIILRFWDGRERESLTLRVRVR